MTSEWEYADTRPSGLYNVDAMGGRIRAFEQGRTSDDRNERKRRISEKGLNRMSNITSGRAQSISSSSLPRLLDHDHYRPPQSHLLDQTKGKLLVLWL